MACTDLRAVEAIRKIEAELNKPVVTVNQAMMFSVMKAVLPNTAEPDFGRLFDQLKR